MRPSRCPTCGKPVSASPPDGSRDLPFCSERCRLVDLGRWFDGQYSISTPIESPEQIAERLAEEQEDPNAEQSGE